MSCDLEIEVDEKVRKRFPKITKILEQLGPYLNQLLHDLDLSNNTITNDEVFENIQIIKLIDIIKQQKLSFLDWDWK